MIKYKATFSVDIASFGGRIGEFIDSVNTTLSTCGISEKLSVRSKAFLIEVKLAKELNKEEKRIFMNALEKSVQETIPQYSVKLESFRRKSGNVQQLASSVA